MSKVLKLASARAAARKEGLSVIAPSWLLEHRITPPQPVSDYLDRSGLIERCLPTNRQLTLLWAPGGFGKTTVLAGCCRLLTERGVRTAWLRLDNDEPSGLDMYLPFSFQRAGLDMLEPLRGGGANFQSISNRTMFLMDALAAKPEPWVLVLDELERLENPESVELLNALVGRAPPNLHLAIACRELPLGFDITPMLLKGAAEIFSAEELRFSSREIERFLGGVLPPDELDAVASTSAGWPIELHVRRSVSSLPAIEKRRAVRDVVWNWMEARLWYALGDEDRELLLDAGLLDYIDAELLDEVLDGTNLLDRLQNISGVTGLIEPCPVGDRRVWRLHTLIRDHCADRRRLESPERYRTVHRRIAIVLARRGDVVEAMRHAVEASDAVLVGEILIRAGGLLYLARYGPDRLIAADRYLTQESIDRYPRLRVIRMAAQVAAGRLAEARRTFRAASELVAESGEDKRLLGEWVSLLGLITQRGCEPVSSELFRETLAASARLEEASGMDPLLRASCEYWACLAHNLKAEFAAALDRGSRARAWLADRFPYGGLALEFQMGQIAMAQGLVKDARECYQSGLQTARRNFLNDLGLVALGETLMRELNLECNGLPDAGECDRIVREPWCYGTQFASYAAVSGVAADVALHTRDAERALAILEDSAANARRFELPAYERFLAGLYATVLAAAGQVEQAERHWRAEGLPESPAACLDLQNQTWREMEVFSLARLRLWLLQGKFEDGRRLLRDLLALAATRGLRRTSMRAMALAVVLEEAADAREAAAQHLTEFFKLFAKTPYGWPLMREGEPVIAVLKELIGTCPDTSIVTSARSLLANVDGK
ncbi:MAG: hypothetical protein OXE40_08535 [Gammaproteobacteria bacterium]|nr:hypothetical protein [Gammaproteobacteria bacterium]